MTPVRIKEVKEIDGLIPSCLMPKVGMYWMTKFRAVEIARAPPAMRTPAFCETKTSRTGVCFSSGATSASGASST